MDRFVLAGVAGLVASTSAWAQTGPVFTLDEIIFTANADETTAERAGFSVEVIDEADLAEAGDLKLADYLDRLPGISLSQQGPQGTLADLRIRGAQSRYISVYVDGILVTDPSATNVFYEDFGALTTSGVKRIEILRGSQSALYGGTAVAGVVNITTVGGEVPEGLSQTLEAEAGSFGTAAIGYTLSQRSGGTTLTFGASHARSDGFSAADENDGNTEEDGFDRTRLSFGIEREMSETLTLGFNMFVEDGSSEFDGFDAPTFTLGDGTPDEEQEREAFGARVYAEYSAGLWEHEVSLSQYRVRRDSASNGTVSTFDGRRTAADWRMSGQVSDQVALSFGLAAQRETARYANTPGGETSVDTYGAFAEMVYSPTDRLDVTTTLRWDDHEAFGGEATGRLGVAWRPDDSTVVRGAVSTGYRPPSIDELFGDYSAFGFVGNPDLEPETSLSYELGVDRVFANGATLSATVFRLEIEELVTFQFGAPSTLVNVPGTSVRQGIELAGSLPLSEVFTLNGAYTYTDAEAADGSTLARVPEHDIVLGLDADWGTWDAGLVVQRVEGLEDGGAPLDDYTVVDARVGYEVSEGIEVYLRVENLFDEEYQTIRGYGTSDRAVYAGLRASF